MFDANALSHTARTDPGVRRMQATRFRAGDDGSGGSGVYGRRASVWWHDRYASTAAAQPA
jgi:hypothetical protein